MKQVDKISVKELTEMAKKMYDSMINIRPRQNNSSRSIESADIRAQIEAVVSEVVHE